MTAGRLASRANAMPAEDKQIAGSGVGLGCGGHRGPGEREGGAAGHGHLLGHGPLTLWDLDGSTTESAQQVGDDVVFDLVLGEPGEHREQPKHHSFDLGRGTSEGRGQASSQHSMVWTLRVAEGLQAPVPGHSFIHSFIQNSFSIP